MARCNFNAAAEFITRSAPIGFFGKFRLTTFHDGDGAVADNFGYVEGSAYNELDQLTQGTLSKNDEPLLTIQFYFDSAGRVVGQTRSNYPGDEAVFVAKTERDYDQFGLLTRIRHENAIGIIDEFNYDYVESGLTVGEGYTNISPHLLSSSDGTYIYDAQGQLLSDGTESWTYDLNGNRTNPGYVTGLNNQLLSDGKWNYAYDAEGNRTSKTNTTTGEYWSYGWNAHNELISVDKHAASGDVVLAVDFAYDPFGNRIEKAVDPDGTGPQPATIERYAIDGWNTEKPTPIGNENYDVWADIDAAGSLTTRYLRGYVVDEIFARDDATSGSHWLLTDYLGSVRDVLASTGELEANADYTAFGQRTTSADVGRYHWTGRDYDAEIELQFNRARYFDTTTGRGISQDPLGFDAGDGNLARYVKNSPHLASDPTGLEIHLYNLITQQYEKLFDDQVKEIVSKLIGNPTRKNIVTGIAVSINQSKSIVKFKTPEQLVNDSLFRMHVSLSAMTFSKYKDRFLFSRGEGELSGVEGNQTSHWNQRLYVTNGAK